MSQYLIAVCMGVLCEFRKCGIGHSVDMICSYNL